MKKNKYTYGLIALAMFLTIATAVPAFAENNNSANQPGAGVSGDNGNRPNGRGMPPRGGMIRPGVYGTVTAVNGNTITVTSTRGPSKDSNGASIAAVTTTFTIDATNAKITKNGVAGTIASILVGDTVGAQGTLTGTNLVATMIRDGKMMGGDKGGDNKGNKNNPNGGNPTFVGNGQPIVAGTVTAINGSSITITNKSNGTYTIDATNAKITKGPNTITVSGVTVGDIVIAQGTVNGNAVVATSIIDQTKPNGTAPVAGGQEAPKGGGGFFGGIGSFFSRLFGF